MGRVEIFGHGAVDAEVLLAGPESTRLTEVGFIERGAEFINDPFLARIAVIPAADHSERGPNRATNAS